MPHTLHLSCSQALQLLCTLHQEGVKLSSCVCFANPSVPPGYLKWSQDRTQKLLFTQPLAAEWGFLSLCAVQLQHISNGKAAIASACTRVVNASFIGGHLTICWFMRNCINIFHLFLLAELHREPHLPPLLLIP